MDRRVKGHMQQRHQRICFLRMKDTHPLSWHMDRILAPLGGVVVRGRSKATWEPDRLESSIGMVRPWAAVRKRHLCVDKPSLVPTPPALLGTEENSAGCR